jgi:branched-subunit amino acid transport protein
MIHPGGSNILLNSAFLVVILTLGAGFALYLIRQIHLPRKLVFQNLQESELSDSARDRLARVDEEVQDIGFAPVASFTVPGLAAVNENRLYWSQKHKTRLVASFTTFRGRPALFLEFVSAFENQAQLNTTNIPRVSYLALPPWSEIDRHPDIDNAAGLFQVHRENLDRNLAEGKGLKDFSTSGLEEEIMAEQVRLMDFQVEQRRFRLNEKRDRYEGTWRIAPASIAFFVDPRAGGIPSRKASATILLACFICSLLVLLIRYLELDSLLGENLSTLLPSRLGFLAYCPAFIISGLIVGWLIPKRGFIWGFVTSLAGLIFLPGAVASQVLLPLISGQSGLLVNRLRESFSNTRPRLAGAVIVLAGLILLGYYLAS